MPQNITSIIYPERYIQIVFIHSNESNIMTEYFRNARLQKWFTSKLYAYAIYTAYLNQFKMHLFDERTINIDLFALI